MLAAVRATAARAARQKHHHHHHHLHDVEHYGGAMRRHTHVTAAQNAHATRSALKIPSRTGDNVADKHTERETTSTMLDATRRQMLERFVAQSADVRAARAAQLAATAKALDVADIPRAAALLRTYLEQHLSFDSDAANILLRFVAAVAARLPTTENGIDIEPNVEAVIANIPFRNPEFAHVKPATEAIRIAQELHKLHRYDAADNIIFGVVAAGRIPHRNVLHTLLSRPTPDSYTRTLSKPAVEKFLDVVLHAYRSSPPPQAMTSYLLHLGRWLSADRDFSHLDGNNLAEIGIEDNMLQESDVVLGSRIALFLLSFPNTREMGLQLHESLKRHNTMMQQLVRTKSLDSAAYYFLLNGKVAEMRKDMPEVARCVDILKSLDIKTIEYYELRLLSSVWESTGQDILPCITKIMQRQIIPTKKMENILLRITNETINFKCFLSITDILVAHAPQRLTVSHFTNALDRILASTFIDDFDKNVLVELVRMVKKAGLAYDHAFFERLIKAHFKLGLSAEEASGIFVAIRAFGELPNLKHYAAFMEGVLKTQPIALADKLFEAISTSLDAESLLLCKLVSFYNAKMYDEVVRTLVDHKTKKHIPVGAFNIAMDALLKSDRPGHVLELFRQMKFMGTQPNPYSYMLLFSALSVTNNYKVINRMYFSLSTQEVRFSKDMVCTMLYAAASSFCDVLIKDALADIPEGHELRSEMVHSILEGYALSEDMRSHFAIVNLTPTLVNMKVKLSNESAEIIFNAFRHINGIDDRLEKLLEVVKQLKKQGHRFGIRSVMLIMETFGYDVMNLPKEAEKILKGLAFSVIGRSPSEEIRQHPTVVAGRIAVFGKVRRLSQAKEIFFDYLEKARLSTKIANSNSILRGKPTIPITAEPFEALVGALLLGGKKLEGANRTVSTEAPLALHVVQDMIKVEKIPMSFRMAEMLIKAARLGNFYSQLEIVNYIRGILDQIYSPTQQRAFNSGPCIAALAVASSQGRTAVIQVWDMIVGILSRVYVNSYHMRILYKGYLISLGKHDTLRALLLLRSPNADFTTNDITAFRKLMAPDEKVAEVVDLHLSRTEAYNRRKHSFSSRLLQGLPEQLR